MNTRAWISSAKRLFAVALDASRTPWGRRLCAAGLMGVYGLLVYALTGFLIAPWLAERAVPRELSLALGRKASVEAVRFNPFSFTLEVRGLRVLEPDGSQTFAGFDLLRVNLDPFWLAFKRLSVGELSLRKPLLRLARDDQGRLNVSDLFTGSGHDASGESFTWAPPDFAYSLRGISLTDGMAVFEDALKGTRHELTNLNFAVGTLASGQPGLREVFSTSGTLNRSHVTLTVRADLSREAPEARIRLDVENLALDHYTPYLYVAKSMDARAARLGLTARLSFPSGAASRQTPVLEAEAHVEDVELLLEEKPVVRLGGLTVQGARFDISGKGLQVERVEFDAPDVHVDRDGEGSMNLARIAGSGREGDSREEAASKPVAVRVAETVVRGGRLAFADKGLELTTELGGLEATLTGLDVAAGRFESLKAAAEGEMFGKLTLEANGAYDPPDMSGRVILSGLDLGTWETLARRFLPRIALSGQMDLDVRCGLSGKDGGVEPSLSAQVSAKDLRLGREGRPKPYLAAQSLTLSQAEVRPAAKTVDVGQVVLGGAVASLVRDASGRLDLMDVLPPGGQGGQGGQGQAWTVRVKDFALSGSAVEYAEPGKAVRLGLGKVSVKDFDSGQAKPMEVAVQGDLDGKAAFSVTGQVALGRPWVGARLELSGLPLATAAGFIPALPVSVQRGELDVAGEVQAGLEQGGLKAGFTGRASVRSLAVVQPGGAPLAELGELSVEGARLGLSPLSVAIDRLTLVDPRLRLTVDKDGSPVWPGATRSKAQASSEAKPAAASGTSALPAYAVGTLAVRGGSVTAALQGFEQPFSAYAWDIRADCRDIRADQPATVSLSALVGHSGKLKAEGKAGWVKAGPLLDLRANLDGLDLGELSPVSRRFTGFPVTRGKMDLNLDYKAGDKGFDFKNKAVITGIQLGPRQPRGEGKDIPLDLAVSLLTDSKGVITLDIPVTGDTAGLKVNLSSVISTAVGGAITKILFSPLAFLNVSRSGGATARVVFEPGTAVLTPEGEKTLSDLAAAVLPRPKIKLDVAAYVDPAGEAEALTRAMMAGAKTQADTAPAAKPGFLGRLRKAPPPPPPAQAPEAEAVQDYARRLAGERLAAVRRFLVEKGTLPEDRIFPLGVDPFAPPKAADAPNWRADVTLGR